jgi:hypothetical protein
MCTILRPSIPHCHYVIKEDIWAINIFPLATRLTYKWKPSLVKKNHGVLSYNLTTLNASHLKVGETITLLYVSTQR